MKRRYADVDSSLKEKYIFEKKTNADLSAEIDKWRARYNSL